MTSRGSVITVAWGLPMNMSSNAEMTSPSSSIIGPPSIRPKSKKFAFYVVDVSHGVEVLSFQSSNIHEALKHLKSCSFKARMFRTRDDELLAYNTPKKAPKTNNRRDGRYGFDYS